MYDKALTQIDKALVSAKTSIAQGSCTRVKAIVLHFLSRYNEALKCNDKAIKLHPKLTIPCLEQKAITLQMLDRYEESIECVKEVLSRSPDRESATLLQSVNAVSLHSLGKFDRALRSINLAISNSYASTWFNYGVKADILYSLGRLDDALDCINAALYLNSDRKMINLATKAKILRVLGRHDEALECTNSALKLVEHPPIEKPNTTRKGSISHSLDGIYSDLVYRSYTSKWSYQRSN